MQCALSETHAAQPARNHDKQRAVASIACLHLIHKCAGDSLICNCWWMQLAPAPHLLVLTSMMMTRHVTASWQPPVVLPDSFCLQECLEGVLSESWASYD